MISKPKLESAVMVVAWNEDASKLGISTTDLLIRNLNCIATGEIPPEMFFPMAGVNVDNDVAQFPESKFFVNEEHNLVVFSSNIPRNEWYKFLETLLDAAVREFHVREIYTLGAMVSGAAHTMPRLLVSIVNSKEMKSELEPYNVNGETDYESQPGQKPTLSAYLAWLSKERGVQAANLWVPVPFYLVPVDDPRSCKRLVYFLNSKFDLGIDFTDLDADIAEQNKKIQELFDRSPDVEKLVRKLEIGEGLAQEESERLAREMADHLKKE